MNIVLDYSRVEGHILVPSSKSISQRICAAALLHKGETIVINYGKSDDEKAALDIIQNLGAAIVYSENKLSIKSDGLIHPKAIIHCGESGLAARLFTPIAALSDTLITFDGVGSLRNRPMHFFKNVLEPLGVKLPGFSGNVPFVIEGPLQPRNITVDGSMSSQFISGLLFAFAKGATQKVKIEVVDLVSKPYTDLTLEVLDTFGYKITHTDYSTFYIAPSGDTVNGRMDIQVESDWSSAAFWIAAAAINGSVRLSGLKRNSSQADIILLEIVKRIGALVEWNNAGLFIESGALTSFNADLTDTPDLFPVLAILAACCVGTSKLKGLHRLVHKESNRAERIAALLSQLKVDFKITQDEIFINGRKSFPSIYYDCPNDHRMAMAAALATMNCEGKIEIENAECVNKSYPDFWKDLQTLTQ